MLPNNYSNFVVCGLNVGSIGRHGQFTAAVGIAIGLLDYLHYRSLVCAFPMLFCVGFNLR